MDHSRGDSQQYALQTEIRIRALMKECLVGTNMPVLNIAMVGGDDLARELAKPVSYTHLTLPTIE